MADRVYPSAKPNPNPNPKPPQSAPTAAPSFPPAKSQLPNRPIYRPQPPAKRRRTRRGCFRSCCCWVVLILISLLLLAALAGGIFYTLYRPQRPNFSVSSLQLLYLNVSASNQVVSSKLNLAVTARNPNKKIVFLYDPISISVTSNGADVGDGSFPGFVHGKKNTTVMRATVQSLGRSVDPSVGSVLRKSSVDLAIELETKAGIKVGGLKTKKMGIRVYCEGIRVNVPKGKKAQTPLTPDLSCRVKIRFKIWKWTF